MPREHGAYGQLAMPLLGGLAVGRPGAPALALVLAFVLAFAAHEPLLVVLGQRGKRMRSQEGARAARLLAALVAAIALSGGLGIALAPPAARAALALASGLGVVVTAMAWRKLEKTTAGEILVATTFAACGAVVALAGGAPLQRASALFVIWVLAFTSAIIAVRSLLLFIKTKGERDRRQLAAAFVVALLALAFAASARAVLPPAAAVAFAPMAIASFVVCVVRVPPRRLRTVGWAIVGSSALTLALLVAGLR